VLPVSGFVNSETVRFVVCVRVARAMHWSRSPLDPWAGDTPVGYLMLLPPGKIGTVGCLLSRAV